MGIAMPKLCHVLTWLLSLPERGINTAEDERFIKVIRRWCMQVDALVEKLEDIVRKIKGEEE